MPPVFKFQEGEKVLCFHGPLIYEAKCLKLGDMKDKQAQYYIHYAGWNKSWDEWVPESRVLKYNEANIQKQKELQRAHKVNSPKSKKANKSRKVENGEKDADGRTFSPLVDNPLNSKQKSSVTTSLSSSQEYSSDDVPCTSKKRLDPTVEPEEQFRTKIEVRVKIPDELKPWLVDDWELITVQKKLVNLPAQITADQILDNYVKYKTSNKNQNQNIENAVVEVAKGIREYFNVMLGRHLLYKFERPQYADVLQDFPDIPMSQVYGSTHLLRLFVKLGGMLAYTPLDERSIQVLMRYVYDFLRYLHKNSAAFFSLQNYSSAPPEYHRKAL